MQKELHILEDVVIPGGKFSDVNKLVNRGENSRNSSYRSVAGIVCSAAAGAMDTPPQHLEALLTGFEIYTGLLECSAELKSCSPEC